MTTINAKNLNSVLGLNPSSSTDSASSAVAKPAAQATTDTYGRAVGLERIDYANDPKKFRRATLETNYFDNKAKGLSKGEAARRPWAASYWPTVSDSVNDRYQSTGNYLNDLSPAEKWDAAMNGWDPADVEKFKPYKAAYGEYDKWDDSNEKYYKNLGPFAKYVSDNKGNKKCREAAKKGLLKPDGKAKSGKENEDYGGLAWWFGLCHAWAPASIREKEPTGPIKMPITYKGKPAEVSFSVSDQKALLIACYANARTYFLGSREDKKFKDIELDPHKRPKSSSMRDVNPGTMHIVLENVIGRDKEAFCEDRTGDIEVWNQPVCSYEVISEKEVTADEAAKLLGDTSYTYNKDAKKFVHCSTRVDYITEANAGDGPNSDSRRYVRSDTVEYVLELDAKGDILGGEWIGSSRENHMDFAWIPYADGGTPLDGGLNINLADVRKLRDKVNGGGGGGSTTGGVKVREDATLKAGKEQALKPITVTEDGVLDVTMTGSGDMDLGLWKNGTPKFDAEGKPVGADLMLYGDGSNENGSLRVKKGDVVKGAFRAYVDSTATVTINSRSGSGSGPEPVAVTERVSLAAKETKSFSFKVEKDCTLKLKMIGEGSGDLDAYARIGKKPEFDANTGKPKPGVNDVDMYDDGSNEGAVLKVKAGDEVFVTMRAYAAGRATMKITEL